MYMYDQKRRKHIVTGVAKTFMVILKLVWQNNTLATSRLGLVLRAPHHHITVDVPVYMPSHVLKHNVVPICSHALTKVGLCNGVVDFFLNVDS